MPHRRACDLVPEDRAEIIRHSQIGPGLADPVVARLAEASAALDLQNATATHEQLCAALPGLRVGLLHGRMRAAEKAATMPILYGGSVNRGNAKLLLSASDVDGLLVGGASLDPSNWSAIVNA